MKGKPKIITLVLVFAITSGIGLNYERILGRAYGLFKLKSTEIGNFIDDSMSIPVDFEQF